MTFEQIYAQYWQKIFRLCMGYVNDHALAQDMTQETFIVVWQQLPKFRGESSVGTWIYRIATNNCLRQIEKGNRFVKTDFPSHLHEENAESTEPQIQFLYQCISEFPETDRLIISMELENIKQAEIAQIMGISEANVRVRIHRMKEKLTQKFKEYGRQ
ncbi:RNA polymerase sigma-70 factor, ECF subfamily [Flexibacter flexilis DSM 6793]|uniref:RNA polymerase sigma-70 factor, ECF subfamily n=1 Tax=Flexibacter flexilis DSM 6793 TaxID=927664 RepID=A0A1I1I2T4_9BACT|nr:RNA polymerase sigma factor [Flexibacter flexilis]SFC30102.1 RNA polymerase sigma-70 factor, ECF subfamily [Flexibacter flexilis DSM 6793]